MYSFYQLLKVRNSQAIRFSSFKRCGLKDFTGFRLMKPANVDQYLVINFLKYG